MSDNILPLPESWQPRCLSNHLGTWLYEPTRFEQVMNMYRAGQLVAAAHNAGQEDPPLLYRAGDIGIVRLSGSLMKAESKYGGTSTVNARAALRAAAQDKDIKGIMLYVDESPGGHASGTAELGTEIKRAAGIKPMRAHADDLVASAAYWAFSQAPVGSLSMNAMGEAGSIGVYAVVADTSEQAKKEGITYHVVKSGEQKADFAPGVPVSKEALGRLQADVDRMHGAFVSAASTGRNMDTKDMAKLATGRTFSAEESISNGLIDHIMSLDEAIDMLRQDISDKRVTANRSRRSQAAMTRLSIERNRLL